MALPDGSSVEGSSSRSSPTGGVQVLVVTLSIVTLIPVVVEVEVVVVAAVVGLSSSSGSSGEDGEEDQAIRSGNATGALSI